MDSLVPWAGSLRHPHDRCSRLPRARSRPAHLGPHPALLTLWDRAHPSWTTPGRQLLIKGVLWKPLCQPGPGSGSAHTPGRVITSSRTDFITFTVRWPLCLRSWLPTSKQVLKLCPPAIKTGIIFWAEVHFSTLLVDPFPPRNTSRLYPTRIFPKEDRSHRELHESAASTANMFLKRSGLCQDVGKGS